MMCHHCGQHIKFGQSKLNEREKARFDWSGDPNGSPNIIEAQCVKAIAEYYGVDYWTDHWDPTLSVSENADIMAKRSAKQGPTMREMRGEYYG